MEESYTCFLPQLRTLSGLDIVLNPEETLFPAFTPTQQWWSCYLHFAGDETQAQGPTSSPKVTQQAFVTPVYDVS